MNKYELEYWKSKLDELWLERVSMIHKGKDLDLAIEYSFIHLLSDETRLINSDTSDFKKLVNTFLINQKPQKLRKKLL